MGLTILCEILTFELNDVDAYMTTLFKGQAQNLCEQKARSNSHHKSREYNNEHPHL